MADFGLRFIIMCFTFLEYVIFVPGEGLAELNPFAMAPQPPQVAVEPHLRPLGAGKPLTTAQELLDALKDRYAREFLREVCLGHYYIATV